MDEHKSLTEAAMRKRREARLERDFKTGAPLAPMFERQAKELLTLEMPPDVGPGGEVVNEQVAGLGQKRWNIRETLRDGADRIAEDASLRRTDLLMQSSFNVVAMGIDAAESIGASNSLEKMLAHQMAVAHEATMRLMDQAMGFEARQDAVESCRLANTAARLMGVFQDVADLAAATDRRKPDRDRAARQRAVRCSGRDRQCRHRGVQAQGAKWKSRVMPCTWRRAAGRMRAQRASRALASYEERSLPDARWQGGAQADAWAL